MANWLSPVISDISLVNSRIKENEKAKLNKVHSTTCPNKHNCIKRNTLPTMKPIIIFPKIGTFFNNGVYIKISGTIIRFTK